MKIRKLVCLMAVCCLLAGCEKKNNDTQAVSDTSATDNVIDTITTTEMISENTGAAVENTDIPEDAVLKITETTYRNGEVWQTLLSYRNAHDDSVAWGYVGFDGEEVLVSHHECKYDDNGKKIYDKSISDTGEYNETEYRDNIEKTKSYDGTGRLEAESEATFDEYGNHIMSHTIVYDQEGAVSLEMLEDYSDCDYDENGKILVCRERSESGEIISTTTNTYDDNGNMLSSEKVYADSEKSSYYSISHSFEYDDKNNLISEEGIWKSDADTVYRTESYEYQYDENGRKIRQDHSYVKTDSDDYDMNISEYTIYEYTEL
ncbi:MAG: hypothetical protein K2G45_05600 [Lachnospiraceae bacterium]|nr:hypothetical protein [Lachnospiraceae bacterium]